MQYTWMHRQAINRAWMPSLYVRGITYPSCWMSAILSYKWGLALVALVALAFIIKHLIECHASATVDQVLCTFHYIGTRLQAGWQPRVVQMTHMQGSYRRINVQSAQQARPVPVQKCTVGVPLSLNWRGYRGFSGVENGVGPLSMKCCLFALPFL